MTRASLSDLVASVPPSGITDTFNRAYALRQQGYDLVDFSVGEPDCETPEHIRAAGIAAIHAGETRYTPSDGTLALKQAIARKFARDNELEFSTDNIVVGAGAKPLLAAAIQSLLNPNDQVIMPTPLWASHLGMVQSVGAKPILVDTQCSNFKLTAAQLNEHTTPQTRLLMLCSPSNPTGAVYSRDELSALAEVLRRHPNIMVISDDLYEHIVFDDLPFWTLAQVAPDLSDRILTVNGLSKAYAMTGWRIGFAGGPTWWIHGIKTVFGQVSGGPCSISQVAGIAALDGPQGFLKENCAIYQSRRDYALNALRGIYGLDVRKPEGAFYIMPNCGGLNGRQTPNGQRITNSTDLANYFLEQCVVVVPGPGFACDPFFRISIATSDMVLREGLARISAAVNALVSGA